MRLWSKKTWMAMFGASLVLGGLTACSSGHTQASPMGAERMAHMRGKVVERISTRLDLDGTQRLKLNALADKIEAQRAAFKGAVDTRSEILSIVVGDKFDRNHAQALVDAKMQAVQANSPEVIAALADFYDSLTPGQQEKVREMMQRPRKGWMARG